ncbi:MAG: outer membrane protein transport protein [Deltaproteobacteria bacterium]|nr:outer membrane protein transport protein [Deltaproteobacteria bacterium]
MYPISGSVQKHPLLVLFFVLMMWSAGLNSAFAQALQRIEIPSSLNPVGSGARALGMGGAFIAVADDATAASWNPGGLIQLETPEVSIVGAYCNRAENNFFGTNPEASGKQNVSDTRINYLSAAYPFTLFGHNMIVSANYQNLYDFNREWGFPLMQESERLKTGQDVGFKQEGGLSAFGIAYCAQMTPTFSFGFTLNFWEDGIYKNKWEQTTRQTGTGTFVGNPFTFEALSHDEFSFSGFNVNLGVLWNVSSSVTLGAVFKTPFKADLRHESAFSYFLDFPQYPSANSADSTAYVEEEHLDMPMSYGLGISCRFSDRFTASADIYRTEWDDFVLTDAKGNESSPITGTPVSESNISPTHQIRIGAEYLFINPGYVVPVRGGIFYDPAPAEGSPDNYFGFSLGAGIAYGRFIFDIAYQYRFGNDVGGSILRNMQFSQDIAEHTVYSSIIVHF